MPLMISSVVICVIFCKFKFVVICSRETNCNSCDAIIELHCSVRLVNNYSYIAMANSQLAIQFSRHIFARYLRRVTQTIGDELIHYGIERCTELKNTNFLAVCPKTTKIRIYILNVNKLKPLFQSTHWWFVLLFVRSERKSVDCVYLYLTSTLRIGIIFHGKSFRELESCIIYRPTWSSAQNRMPDFCVREPIAQAWPNCTDATRITTNANEIQK